MRMRLKETYSNEEYIEMLTGKPISFMRYIFDEDDIFYNDIYGIYSGYFTRSNNKLISPIFKGYYDIRDKRINQRIKFYRTPEYSNISQKIYSGTDIYIETSDYQSLDFQIKLYKNDRVIYEDYNTYGFIESEAELSFDYMTISVGEKLGDEFDPLRLDILEQDYDLIFKIVQWKSAYQNLASIIRSKYLKKWTDTYNVLATEFDPLNDFKRTEENSGKDKKSLKYGKTISKTVEDEGSFTHGEVIDKTYDNRGNETTRTYTNYNITNENINQNEDQDYVFGFNSSSEVSTDKSITKDASKDVTTYDGTYKDKTLMNGLEKDKHSGTDNTTRNITDKQSNTGTDEDTIEYGKKIQIDGYNENPTRNLQKALDFHAKNIFYDIIYDDIDSIVALSIY